jgi:hypothetical protein
VINATRTSRAPLKPAEDAYQLDSSELTIDEVVNQVLALVFGEGSRKTRRCLNLGAAGAAPRCSRDVLGNRADRRTSRRRFEVSPGCD